MKFHIFVVLCLISLGAAAQNKISGTVVDAEGAPLVGASVVVKGTTIGVMADVGGAFTITAPSDATLVVSFVGFSPVEIPVEGKSVLRVEMKEGQQIDEVVVVGYGTMRKRDLTGSISSVKGDVLKQIPVASAAEALTGKLAGVQVTTSEGVPGAEIKIRVRGGGSITQDNEPLYIIDGFPSDDGLTAVDPADIESIDVLKDASSTAIYGARGANGVIIITTKGGKEAKTSVSYDGYMGVRQLARKLEVMTPYEFTLWQYNVRTIMDDARMTGFSNIYGEWDDLYYLYSDREGIDWQGELFGRSAFAQTHNLSINGGSKTTKFNIGYTYNGEEGTLINTGYVRSVAKMRFDHRAFNDKLAISVNATYSKRGIDGGGSYGSTKRLADAILYRPTMGISYTDEQLLTMDEDETSPGTKLTNLYNPIKTQQSEYRFKENAVTTVSASADYEIVKGLNLKIMGGFSNDFQNEEQQDGAESKSAKLANQGGNGIWAKVGNRRASKWSNTNTLTYKVDLKEIHSLNFMLGNEQVGSTTKNVTNATYQFPDVGIILDNLSLGTMPGKPTSSNESSNLMSFFGRAFYSYRDKYLLTATVRADGSSKFSAANRWGVFPSVSGAWRVSDEAFVRESPLARAAQLSSFKLRASYGEAGNNRISNDQFRLTYTNGYYGLEDQQSTSVYPSAYANPDLKWETTVSRNVGLDWGVLKGRLGGAVDLYMNDTRDLLLAQDVASVSGYTSQIQNIGSTRNQGLEVTINAVPVIKNGFTWSVDFNISFNKNKVISLGGGMSEFFYSTGLINSEYDYIVRVGESVGAMYGYVTDGYYKVDEFTFDPDAAAQKANEKNAWIANAGANTPTTELYDVMPGVIKFKDLNNDGKITPEDRTIIGDATPTHFGGLNNTFTYKGFDLSIFVNWVYGQDVYNVNRLRFSAARNRDENALAIMNDSWRVYDGSGQDMRYNPEKLQEMNANVKYWRPFSNVSLNHSWGIEDGSFLRINNITLGYSLPESWLSRVKIQKLRIYATANNLHVFTGYSGYDPEVDTQSSPVTPNADYSSYPRSKTYIVGFNLTF
ncbi:MAG: TonB-dependent receptor [Prevotellaceae bacterium]|jgi:TonB-linked SusC/RagA family outer membrane protein|nr:TonB-dependent receptor [Prevotellaceae bacterium]